MKSRFQTRASCVIALGCFVMLASVMSAPTPGVASEHAPALWVRKALPQGTFEGTAKKIPVSLMLTPRTGGVQVYSLSGDYQMRLGWVPGLGGYLGRRDVNGGWVREMQVVVDRQVQIDGVSTARRVKIELRSWERGHPGLIDRSHATLKRVSSGIDVAIVLDRTGSMTQADLANVQAGARAMLEAFDSPQIWVGLAALPYGQPEDPCVVANPQAYPAPAYEPWEVTALSPDHSTIDGRVDPASQIVTDIACLHIAASPTVTVDGQVKTSAGHTNLGDPLYGAVQMANLEGRNDAQDVVVFMTDGEANQPDGMTPCAYFDDAASQAKADGAAIFTIGFGVEGARCSRDGTGAFRNAYATTVLAAVATDSKDNSPGACVPSEDRDGDHYFCRDAGASLTPPFRKIAAAALGVVPTRPCLIGCW